MATKTKQEAAQAKPSSNGERRLPEERLTRDGRSPGSMDAMLTDAALGPGRRFLPGASVARAATKLALRPHRIAARTIGLGAELGRIAVGRSEVAPEKGDRRFKDPAWESNPAYKRLGQSYLAAGKTVDHLISEADLDWRTERRVRFAVENLVAALAPTNFPALNPAVVKATFDNGGQNLARGGVQLARDMVRAPRLPSMVDLSAFEVGQDLALTPGSVVVRTPVFELIQYQPSTKKVRETPLVVVPPMINKYYITDLAPGRSMIEYLVGQGQQVFALSWRNPDERHSDWSLDTYAQAVVEALDAAQAITGAGQVHAAGLCAGGITLSATAAHLADRGDLDRLAGLSLAVCVLDTGRAGTAGALVDPGTAALAVADSARRGYLSGKSLAGVFAWLRPNDLIWNYWVSNYLLGKEPPAFDILYWNADSTNLPAGLHRDFMEMSLGNTLVQPGAMEVLESPVDLTRITTDSYVVAGIADHITPWESAYATTQVLGSRPRFVLSNSGHIAAMVNPPGNEKASFRTLDHNPAEAETFLAHARQQPGTWWDDWAAWLGERSGKKRDAPKQLGGKNHEALGAAPGEYVHG
jgi:class II poly(R)-hydroxyalkanoic acid synthase